MNYPDFSKQIRAFNFILDETVDLKVINSTAFRMHHKTSGAKLIYLKNDDPENLFSVAFRTPPYDNTGLPHIMEHTVLAGSKKYPLKDPFVELLKSSVATFLNAMTYPDKTVYPCASMNEQDFHNIMRVYCDAVFFPKISREKFNQEGYHYEFIKPENPKSNLTVKGVVYNEMKGVYSDLNGIISREETKSLFPDNVYGKDSGGHPDYIKTLKYKDFKKFHDLYYHPSNAYFFVYGSFPILKTLQILHKEFLCKFNSLNLDIKIQKQADWNEPIEKTTFYPLSKNTDIKRKTAITVNFKTNCLTDTLETLSMSVIEEYLLGNSSSPLRRAIVDSKVGDSLTSSGYGDYQHDTYFTVGIKGTEKKNKNRFLKIIFDTLRKEVKEGFDTRKLEAAFHKLEFAAKEITGSYPIHLMDRLYNYWLYDADPFCLFKLSKHIDKLKKLCNEQNKYLEKILEKNILHNKSYSILTFIPDKRYTEKTSKKFKDEMFKIKNTLSAEDTKKIIKNTIKFNKMQSTPDSAKAIATLPKLKLSDIPEKPYELPTATGKIVDRPFLQTNLFTNGINYITIAFDLLGIDKELIDYLPLYKLALLRTGTPQTDYLEMAELETLYTGGISAALHSDGKFDSPETLIPTLTVTSKATDSNTDKMLRILWDKIKNCRLDNKKRLYDIIIQQKTALISGIIPAGSTYAQYYSARNLNLNHYFNNKFNGISAIRFIKNLAENFDAQFDSLVNKLRQIKKYLLNRNRIFISTAGSNTSNKLFLNWSKNFIESLEVTPIKKISYSLKQMDKHSAGICQPAEVSFNAMSFSAIKATDNNAAALFFLGQYLTYNYLWEKIRMESGAYGTNAFYSTLGGFFGFSSFRDPCIKKTYDTFYKTVQHICKEMNLRKCNIEKNIIGSFKKLDKPIRPGNAVNLALNRYLRNINFEYRTKFRSDLLSLNKKKILSATHILEENITKANKCTITNKKNLDAFNKQKRSIYYFDIEHI